MSALAHHAGKLLEVGARRRRAAVLASCGAAFAALALSGEPAMAGCNSGATNRTSVLHGASCEALASGNMATAVGDTARATSVYATALGHRSDAPADGSTRVGTFARGAGVWSTAIGGGRDSSAATRAQGTYSIAIGGGDENFVGGNRGARAWRAYGIAIGTGAEAFGQRSVAVGDFAGDGAAETNATNAAFGSRSGRSVDGSGNTAIGSAAGFTVNGNNNTAGGALAGWTINGRNNAAYGVGSGSFVTGDANVAMGASAGRNITASNTVAVGTEASTSRNGAGREPDRHDQSCAVRSVVAGRKGL